MVGGKCGGIFVVQPQKYPHIPSLSRRFPKTRCKWYLVLKSFGPAGNIMVKEKIRGNIVMEQHQMTLFVFSDMAIS